MHDGWLEQTEMCVDIGTARELFPMNSIYKTIADESLILDYHR